MRDRRPDYDAPAFRAAWYGDEPLREVADSYGVSIASIYEAAMRRGFVPRRWHRAGRALNRPTQATVS